MSHVFSVADQIGNSEIKAVCAILCVCVITAVQHYLCP